MDIQGFQSWIRTWLFSIVASNWSDFCSKVNKQKLTKKKREKRQNFYYSLKYLVVSWAFYVVCVHCTVDCTVADCSVSCSLDYLLSNSLFSTVLNLSNLTLDVWDKVSGWKTLVYDSFTFSCYPEPSEWFQLLQDFDLFLLHPAVKTSSIPF